jgi:Holliday junction DNA helicase RuvA
MISYLQGKLVESLPTQITVDVNGVGYEIFIPLSSYDLLPQPGQSIRVLVQLVVREDSHTLYGFMSPDQRDLFKLLVHSVSGIGPKTAIQILSGISVTAFKGAVVNNDIKTLSSISGVGKKTAERIVVELKDKIGIVGAWEAQSAKRALSHEEQLLNDAILALIGLGYKQIEAHKVIRAALNTLGPKATVEELLREALRNP